MHAFLNITFFPISRNLLDYEKLTMFHRKQQKTT